VFALYRISNNLGNSQHPDGEQVRHEMEPIPEEGGDVAEMLKSVDGLLEQTKQPDTEEDKYQKDDAVDVHISYDDKDDVEGKLSFPCLNY